MDIKNHFAEVGKMVEIGSNAKSLKKLEKERKNSDYIDNKS